MKKYFLISLIAIFLTLGISWSVSAETIKSQTVSSAISENTAGIKYAVPLGNGLTGTVSSIKGGAYNSGTVSKNWATEIGLASYTNSDYTGFVGSCVYAFSTVSINAEETAFAINTEFDVDCGSFAELDPDLYYIYIWSTVSNGSANEIQAVGLGDSGLCIFSGGNPSLSCSGTSTNLSSLYYNLDTTDIPVDEEVSTIGITGYLPVPDATNVNAYTTFSGTYDNDGTYDTVLIFLTDHTNEDLESFNQLKVCDVAQVGVGLTYSCSVSLRTNTEYSYTPSLWKQGEDWPEFQVLDEFAPYFFETGMIYETQAPPVSSTCSAFDVGCYLENVISWTFGVSDSTLQSFNNLTLRNSLPFSYIYDLGNIYEELFSNGESDLDITITTGIGDITLISATQISNIPMANTIRTILGYLIYFFTIMTIYYRVIKVHDKTVINQTQ